MRIRAPFELRFIRFEDATSAAPPRFDDETGSASSGAASWLSPSAPTLTIAARDGISCEDQTGDPNTEGARLSVGLPATVTSGDSFNLEDLGATEGVSVFVSVAGNRSFRFSRGWIVMDERDDEQVSLRIDVTSSDGTKSARGAVIAPFCP